MRQLATIQKISALDPIEGADRIEVATVLGWKVVTQKGLHIVDDLVVFFEIDSLLPVREEFEFLRKSSYTENTTEGPGFRLKTIRMKGQISQGLIVPIRELTDNFWLDQRTQDSIWTTTDGVPLTEGLDVTELLGVKKYERPLPSNLAGIARGNFPSFIPKTDQTRIQSFYKTFVKDYASDDWEVSLKLDGSSMTVYYLSDEDRFGVCSRNLDLTETDDNLFWKVARKLDLENKLKDMSKNGNNWSLALQGELVGPGVNSNWDNLSDHDFFVFDLWSINEHAYAPAERRKEFIERYGISHVPVYDVTNFEDFSVADFLELADNGYGGGSLKNPIREGLVFKNIAQPNVSFKSISNRYLLSGGE